MTLLMGGDTDTNAAIVCGMMGALHGWHGIPPGLLRPVLHYTRARVGGRGHERPPFCTPAAALPELARHWVWLRALLAQHGLGELNS
jgi:hypothetical protein